MIKKYAEIVGEKLAVCLTRFEIVERFIMNLRPRGIRQIERAYASGHVVEGDRLALVYDKPSFLSRFNMTEGDRWLYSQEMPCSNIGVVAVGKTLHGRDFCVLHDSESTFRLDDGFSSWEKLIKK